MGMFDTVKYNNKFYQTKEFDCAMFQLKIENNRLFQEIGRYESVPKEERPYPNAEEGSLNSFIGCMKWIHEEWKDLNFHGIFRGLNVSSSSFEELLFEELLFKFTDGELVEVTDITNK